MISLSIIVPTKGGRPYLDRCLASITPQLRQHDELLISCAPGSWGYPGRNAMLKKATGHAICFMDDDDIYTEGALDVIREAVQANCRALHVFRMRYGSGHVVWIKPEIKEGEVASQIIVVPNLIDFDLPEFGLRYQGDFDFAAAVAKELEVIWHDEIICEVRPGETHWEPGPA